MMQLNLGKVSMTFIDHFIAIATSYYYKITVIYALSTTKYAKSMFSPDIIT